ncbi:MAG: CpsD/CapB family tyrosine-protein kinase [Pirellulales bacterium]
MRVDVPQAAREAARQEEIERNASIAMGFVQSESQSRSGESLPNESMRNESMRSDTMRGESAHAAPHPKAAPQVDYDRLRTAAAISAREEKLRHQVHKPFNPVWEVDNLQWPTVCNKLMEQRAESLAQVGAHLKAACQDGLGIMAVTSPSAGEGRTTVTCCLGLLAASHGLKTVVIDLDLDNPTLCMQTNLEVEHDWRDTLTEDISLEEAAVHSINDQLTIMPLKPRQGRPSLMASDRRMSDMLRELSGSFDLVIVDTSRMKSSGSVVAGLADAKIFDAAVIVVDRRNTDSSRIDETVRAIQQSGIESIGIVDNFAF